MFIKEHEDYNIITVSEPTYGKWKYQIVLAEAEFTVDNAREPDEPPPDEAEEPGDPEEPPPASFVTQVSIDGDRWLLNGVPTNAGSAAEGLLLNSRMVQATFEDTNPATVGNWSYPDGAAFDPARQTAEFIAMVPVYADHGLNAITLSLQGGRPMRGTQVWVNGAFAPDGALRESYMERVAQVIEALDQHGMVAIVSYFYFGQDQNLEDEAALLRATRDATDWLVDRGYTNVIVELVNEAGHRDYDHEVLGVERVHVLVEAARERAGDRLMLSASLGGGKIPPSSLMRVSDYHLLHGNNQSATRVAEMVDQLRSKMAYGGQPIVFNEDSTDLGNMAAAVAAGASWGYYDQGENDYLTGFQSPPTNWTLSTPEKRAFFEEVRRLTRPRD